VIDPGIALGWNRYGYLPHPFQIFVGRQVREKIIGALAGTTDIVFSHFDGDHVPLAAPNPYQLRTNTTKKDLLQSRIWAKRAEPSSRLENRRRVGIEDSLKRELLAAEGGSDGAVQFSMPLTISSCMLSQLTIS
jgi:predicted metallo-beta-lactamase superfamily hydrolase